MVGSQAPRHVWSLDAPTCSRLACRCPGPNTWRTKGKRLSGLRNLGLQLVKPWKTCQTVSTPPRPGSSVVSRQSLRCEGAQVLWKDDWMFKPCLEVAGAGLDDGARCGAVGSELRERDPWEIVEGGVAMLARRTDVMCEPRALWYLRRESRSRTALAGMLSRPGSMPRLLRTPIS